ncbi:hypothetical protein ADL12_27250 [Streptomyces regalis]|uniref:Uncharacterized protein n=1 Tax=Streptomyces regalis TaxID=68262 RepID=A0A101JNQ7_9ACTN|nr:hypothetical protein ADL12_27250 [Streptomyces regalis]
MLALLREQIGDERQVRRRLELRAASARGDLAAVRSRIRDLQAFTAQEVVVIGRAARVALLRDEPWLPDLLDRLLPGIAVAPTAAKTLPSQALPYELVRAAQDFPTPELVTAIRSVRRTVRHAGVPKQLDKLLKKVEAALAERTDVALRLPKLDSALHPSAAPPRAASCAGPPATTRPSSRSPRQSR